MDYYYGYKGKPEKFKQAYIIYMSTMHQIELKTEKYDAKKDQKQ